MGKSTSPLLPGTCDSLPRDGKSNTTDNILLLDPNIFLEFESEIMKLVLSVKKQFLVMQVSIDTNSTKKTKTKIQLKIFSQPVFVGYKVFCGLLVCSLFLSVCSSGVVCVCFEGAV